MNRKRMLDDFKNHRSKRSPEDFDQASNQVPDYDSENEILIEPRIPTNWKTCDNCGAKNDDDMLFYPFFGNTQQGFVCCDDCEDIVRENMMKYSINQNVFPVDAFVHDTYFSKELTITQNSKKLRVELYKCKNDEGFMWTGKYIDRIFITIKCQKHS